MYHIILGKLFAANSNQYAFDRHLERENEIFFFAMISFSLFLLFAAYEESIAEFDSPYGFPNPYLTPEKCGRPNVAHSRICDPGNLLGSVDKDVLEGHINGINKCEMGVAIVREISSSYVKLHGSGDVSTATRNFAIFLHNSWGVGDKETQNGVLIFLSVNDRSVYVSVGSGLRQTLSDNLLATVISNMKPSLREKNYAKAIEYAILEVNMVLEGKLPSIPRQNGSRFNLKQLSDIFSLLGFGLVIWMTISGIYRGYRTKRMKPGAQAMNRFIRDVSDMQSNTYASKSCPICLEDFPFPPTQPQELDSSTGAENFTYMRTSLLIPMC